MQEDKSSVSQMRFPQKLWYLLNMRTDAILWGGTGRTILLNYNILHNYLQCDNSIFKTTNIASFVRQLNLYGFRKVTSHLQDPLCNSSNPYMHEYIHDYFQYGRPEWLNKITRKALTMRKFKTMLARQSETESMVITPLQKARQAFYCALQKAVQDSYLQSSSKELCCPQFDCSEVPEDYCEDEENVELDWIFSKNPDTEAKQNLSQAVTVPVTPTVNEDSNSYGETSQDLMNFNDEPQTTNDSFPGQFLNMPALESESREVDSGVELLAEFNIEQDIDQGIITKLGDKNDHSLNCVLPSISNDQIDYASLEQGNNDVDQYNGEWDQMFNDMMASKSSNQECSSDLKDFYSQISQTIDLLNP
ncbi:HSF-type DNA-binding domain-containing protein [Phthorimaea operculella]|nr:HSF-type DNA-binding domain-containing protein [Phthorimaea operculella]